MLTLLATPIGNLEDITLRGIRVLKEADMVLCEDTRVTKKLLAHYDIHTPCLSYHEHSGESKEEKILALLAEEKQVVLVSDAGMPPVSDPGARVVHRAREEGYVVSVVPGASAPVSALALSGFSGDRFSFFGFPPHKKGRATFFSNLLGHGETCVFFESPHRLIKALESLAEQTQRRIAVCREISKIHEEVRVGSPEEVLAYYREHPDKVRGECVVVVDEA
jgi:16S rRNA (cytidine1402-2'-O)-methyltransferase